LRKFFNELLGNNIKYIYLGQAKTLLNNIFIRTATALPKKLVKKIPIICERFSMRTRLCKI
jgi:hypothetical protein